MLKFGLSLARLLASTSRDLAPIVLVVGFFQTVVLRQPFPDFADILIGLFFVLLGLTLFIRGLDMALFPIGDALAGAFARRGSVAWLLAFAFALGLGTTVAEPALIAVGDEAARVMAAAGQIADDPEARPGRAGSGASEPPRGAGPPPPPIPRREQQG